MEARRQFQIAKNNYDEAFNAYMESHKRLKEAKYKVELAAHGVAGTRHLVDALCSAIIDDCRETLANYTFAEEDSCCCKTNLEHVIRKIEQYGFDAAREYQTPIMEGKMTENYDGSHCEHQWCKRRMSEIVVPEPCILRTVIGINAT